MNKQLFSELVDKYLDGTATAEERRVVETYYDELAGEPANALSDRQKAILKEKAYNAVQQHIAGKVKVVPLWRKLAAAAVLLFVLSGAAYFFLHKKAPATDMAALPQQQRFKNDIAPAHKGAMLTLADGSMIRLDSA